MRNYFIFVLFLELILECKSQEPLCGIRFNKRIVGGIDSNKNDWPWMVSIQLNNKHICGGTLIDSSHVLTAAHCFVFSSATAYKVLLGTNNLTSSETIRRSVSNIIKHELYNDVQAFDIALLKLAKPVDYDTNILPACLPSLEDTFEGERCSLTGWGLTYSNGNVQETLREVNLDVMTESECENFAGSFVEHKYCTGKPLVAQDTCQGDSGGGMHCLKKDKKFYVAGIVSYGLENCGTVGINTRVDYFIDWIHNNLLLLN